PPAGPRRPAAPAPPKPVPMTTASNGVSVTRSLRPLDHFVGAQQDRLRDSQDKRFGHLEVDHHLELRRLLDGEIAGLGAFEDLVDKRGGASVQIVWARAVEHEPTGFPLLP